MWQARTYTSEGWQSLRIAEVAATPTTEAMLAEARKTFRNDEIRLYQHLEAELPFAKLDAFGQIGREPIAVWAKAAEEQSKKFDWSTGATIESLDDEAISLYRRDESKAAVIAWHEPTAVVICVGPGDRELQIEFVPDTDTDDRAARLRYRYADADYTLQTWFDWRGYFGANSAVADGAGAMQGNGRGFVTSLRVGGGHLVGRVLRRLVFGNPTLERDPLAIARERSAAERHAFAARSCPPLDLRHEIAAAHAMVFVHGTASCGVQGLKDLFDTSSPPQYPVRRYEHDTFVSIHDNAQELAQLIRTNVRVNRLLLVAHSRGGLVARLALDQLVRDGYPAQITLDTYGTPHAGTSLVRAGNRLLSQIYKIGEWGVAAAAPVLSPLTWAHGFLFDAPVLPRGIAVMADDSDTLPVLARLDAAAVTCFGAAFDVKGLGSGFAPEIEGVLGGWFEGISNDLVVRTSSALAVGTPQPVLNCSHLQYFMQPTVRQRLRNYFGAPPPSPPAVAAPPAPTRKSLTEQRQETLRSGARKLPFRKGQ